MGRKNRRPNRIDLIEIMLGKEPDLDDDLLRLRFLDEVERNDWGCFWSLPLRGDFNWITDRIVVGAGFYSADDVRELEKIGVTHLLDCRYEVNIAERMAEEFPQLVYVQNGCDDDGRPKSVEYFRKSIEFGLAVLAQPGTVLYVNCAAGINRGPSSAFAIMRAAGMSFMEAFSLLKTNRPICRIAYAEDADRAVYALGYDSDEEERIACNGN